MKKMKLIFRWEGFTLVTVTSHRKSTMELIHHERARVERQHGKSGLIMYWSLSHDSIKTGGKRQTRAWTSLFPLGFVSIPRFPSSLTSESRCPPPRFGRKSLELWNGPVHVYKKKGRSKRGGMSKRKREGKKRQRTATKKAKACMLGNEHKR